MSKKKCTDGRRNNRPPKEHQWKPGQSGNPKGAPKKEDRMKRFSMDSFRSFIMNDAWKEVEIVEKDGRVRKVPKIFLIISQLNNKAAKGDMQAARLALKYLEAAASANDAALYDAYAAWAKMQERILRSSRNPGSLEHYDAMYDYYMFKRDMRRGEGEESWPYEYGEPRTKADWHLFIKHHEALKSDPLCKAPWPIEYEEDIFDYMSPDERIEYLLEEFERSRETNEEPEKPDEAPDEGSNDKK